ncbi:MAG: NUDIX hydrolase [Patescibacteria group bacterium]
MVKIIHDSATPAHGQQVISVCAFIHYKFDGVLKVFLPMRALTKKFLPGIYELPGGHVDFGEDLVVALKREVSEEFEMNVNVGDAFAAFTYQNLIKGSHSVEVIYFASFTDPLDQIKFNPEDHASIGWFTRAEVVANSDRLIPTEHVTQANPGDDPEFRSILKGFDLLNGAGLDFGQAKSI